jgi:hypothetical protein
MLRIALCGYEGEHDMPPTWECVAWKANGGYSSQNGEGNANPNRERIWFSPHCGRPTVGRQVHYRTLAEIRAERQKGYAVVIPPDLFGDDRATYHPTRSSAERRLASVIREFQDAKIVDLSQVADSATPEAP